ncbi:MAG: hypothetical protein ACIPMY_07315 [Rickettsia endosymbiont of Pentastiridius leporinus]
MNLFFLDTVVKPRSDTERFSDPYKQASRRNDITDIHIFLYNKVASP